MYDLTTTAALIETALGRLPYDLIIQNVQVLNVFSGQIRLGCIGVKQGRIVGADVPAGVATQRTFDGRGLYALPGFIDSHVHIEPTMLLPEHLAELIVPHGTTALLADLMEIANVAGRPGIDALLSTSSSLPFHLLVEVPSRVPTAPGLETTGGELGLVQVSEMLSSPRSVSLGELDPTKVLGIQMDFLARVGAARAQGKIANGHAAGLQGKDLLAYACAGLADDHECVTYDEAKARLELGMAILVREGSTERNLEALVRGLVQEGADTRHWMFCTDDKHPTEILREGHIDYMVNRATGLGLPVLRAIQMATLNPASHFRIGHDIGSLAPGRWADIILAERLTPVEPAFVFCRGELVAEGGRLVSLPAPGHLPGWLRETVTLLRGAESTDYRVAAGGSSALVRVIRVLPDQIINVEEQVALPVVAGNVMTDVDKDVLKLAVVERYGKNGNIAVGFVRGFGLQRGAISSTIAHDHHNLIIAGADERSMATCALATKRMGGGLVVADGNEVLAQLPLPLGGLLSGRSAAFTIDALDRLNAAAAALNCRLPAPFMTLSFISLPSVPELGITDMGLVNVREGRLVSAFA